MDSTVTYGLNPVVEALIAENRLEVIYLAVGLRAANRKKIESLANERGIRVLKADKKELDRLSQGGAHQGVVALGARSAYLSLEELAAIKKPGRTVILCLDGVQDPRNLGALARSAQALGASGLLVPVDRAAGITPAAMKASAGALARLPVARVTNIARALDKLKDLGFWVTGAAVEEGMAPWEFDPGDKVVLVLGSEGSGVRKNVASRFDHLAKIPMSDSSESLNVSVAGALFLYEWLGRAKSP